MKKILSMLMILFQVSLAFSQTNMENISFELRYPFPVGNNFLNKGATSGYSGIADLEVDLNLVKVNKLTFGILFGGSVLRLSETDMNLLILSPKINMDYRLDFKNVSIIPDVAVGLSNCRFRSPARDISYGTGDPVHFDAVDYSSTGITMKGATKLVFNRNKRIEWYFLVAYEFTRLEKPSGSVVDSNFNRNIQILYPGIGLSWKFRKG